MLALVPGNKNAIYQAFNVCSDRAITFNGLVKAIGAAAGKEPKIVHYDPEKVGLKKGEGFPFRTGHFFADPTKAKLLLGWQPKHNFLGDVKQRLEEYHLTNRLNAAPDFSTDDKILAVSGFYLCILMVKPQIAASLASVHLCSTPVHQSLNQAQSSPSTYASFPL